MDSQRRSRLRRFLLLTACVLAPGCAPDEGSPPAAAAPEGAPLAVEEAPLLSVGVLEGDTLQEFHGVVTPFLLPDGRLVVPLAGAGTIRIFGPDGAFSASLGRPGEGPGEFASLNAAWARGDTIEAFDSRLGRVTRFLPDGSTDVVSLEPVGSAQVAVPGVLADGWVLVGVEAVGPDGRDRMLVHRFDRDGSHLGELAEIRGMIRYATPAGGRGPEPLSPRAVFAVRHGAVYVAETLTPRIEVLDGRIPETADSLKRIVRWEPGTTPSPHEALGAVVDSAVARAEPGRAADLRERLEYAPVPDRLSAFWGFRVDANGFIWVRPYEPGEHAAALGGLEGAGPGGEWSIFSPDGARVGSVEMPGELEPLRIGSDAVVGIRRDALGVESVRVHALERR